MESSLEEELRRICTTTSVRAGAQPITEEILRKPGYIPANCGEPRAVISEQSVRLAYRMAVVYINRFASAGKGCCTIDHFNVLKLYEATELPVKLTKADPKTTFFYSEDLDLKH